MKATACLILVWGFFVRLFAFNFNWFDICLFIRSICFYTSKKALWLGQLFSKKMIIFLRYSLNPVCHSVISLFSEVIGSKCFFLLGINNSWFHCCFHEGVPFCGEYWCFWMAQRGLSPCVFAQHWISKGISFLLVPFAGPFQMNKNGSISEWNPAQNSPTATSFHTSMPGGSAEGWQAFNILPECQVCKWDYKPVTTVMAGIMWTPVHPMLDAG